MILGHHQHWVILVVNLIGCYTISSKGSLTSWPQNTEAVIDQKIRLSCSSSDPYLVNWEHVRCGAKRKEFVYFGGGVASPYDSRFRIITDGETGQYDLEITAVRLEDAGRYRCIDREGQGERREAELVVLDSPPLCYCEHMGGKKCEVTKPEDMRVTCQASYAGNAVPELKCDNMTDVVAIDVQKDSRNVKYVFVFSADPQTMREYDTCRTSVSNISSSRFNTNVAYVVRTKKRQMTIKSAGFVTCEVNSSRACQYKWVRCDQNNETVSTEQKMFIAEPGLYRCEADCEMADVNCRIEPVEVNFERESVQLESDETNLEAKRSLLVVIVLIAVTAPLCVIIIIASFLLWLRHKKKGVETKGSAEEEAGLQRRPHQDQQTCHAAN